MSSPDSTTRVSRSSSTCRDGRQGGWFGEAGADRDRPRASNRATAGRQAALTTNTWMLEAGEASSGATEGLRGPWTSQSCCCCRRAGGRQVSRRQPHVAGSAAAAAVGAPDCGTTWARVRRSNRAITLATQIPGPPAAARRRRREPARVAGLLRQPAHLLLLLQGCCQRVAHHAAHGAARGGRQWVESLGRESTPQGARLLAC